MNEILADLFCVSVTVHPTRRPRLNADARTDGRESTREIDARGCQRLIGRPHAICPEDFDGAERVHQAIG